jgi:hypothetical protein
MKKVENTKTAAKKTAATKTTAKQGVNATEVVDGPQAAQPGQEPQRNVLLGTISYTNEADYEQFLSNLDLNQAMFILIAGANHGQSKGLYNLDESELIARAIKTIKKNSTPATPAASTESNS